MIFASKKISKKIVISLLDKRMVIATNEGIIFDQKTAVVVTKSLRPSLVYYGESAIENLPNMDSRNMFLYLFSGGLINHYEVAKVYIKNILGLIFDKNTILDICVLVDGSLDNEQKKLIEKVFFASGYQDVILMDNLLPLSYEASKNDINVLGYVGDMGCEVGIVIDNNIYNAYSLNIGISTAKEKLATKLKEKLNIFLNENQLDIVFCKLLSLHELDLTTISITGVDMESKKERMITLSSIDVYETIDFVFGRFAKVLQGMIMTAPSQVQESVLKNGVLLSGVGADIVGVNEYLYKHTNINFVLRPNACIFGAIDLFFEDKV